MTEFNFLDTGPPDSPWRLILAHGAGAPMDSDFMNRIAENLGALGIAVRRFEFPYMAQRRLDGRKRPPDRPPVLLPCWREAIAATEAAFPNTHIAIGGKSMGGRMATLLAAEPDCPLPVRCIVTLGYPFHPPGKPEKTRTDHLTDIVLPLLMIQGTRDPFGKKEEVETYTLPGNATLHWIDDGDHDLKPRKITGRTQEDALSTASATICQYFQNLR